MNALYMYINLFNTVLLVCVALGGLLAFRSGKRQAVVNIQRETIEALNQRIAALESRQIDLEKENDHLRFIIETTQAALKQKGIAITVDGDLVTISDSRGHSSSSKTRRKPAITVKSPEKAKEHEV